MTFLVSYAETLALASKPKHYHGYGVVANVTERGDITLAFNQCSFERCTFPDAVFILQ